MMSDVKVTLIAKCDFSDLVDHIVKNIDGYSPFVNNCVLNCYVSLKASGYLLNTIYKG